LKGVKIRIFRHQCVERC